MVLENGFLIKTVDGITDEMFFDLCQANSELRMERDQYGNIIVMSPTGMNTGNFNGDVFGQVWLWNRRSKIGYAFDSSSGYTLPNGAIRSSDVSWIIKDRWESFPGKERKIFTRTYPDFAVEVRSESDQMKTLKVKMEGYRNNGCRLGWLIGPRGESVHTYRQDGSIEIKREESIVLSGEDVLPGLLVEIDF